MSLVSTKEMFRKAHAGRYAIGAFNVDNIDVMQAVLEGASRAKSPVIIAVSEGALKFMHPVYVHHAALAAAEENEIPIALHLDHGKSFEVCKTAIDNGFTSVMIDASAYDFEENIRITKAVVDYAHAHGVVVEGELGAIAGIEDDIVVEDKYGQFTHPKDAEEFVRRTGIDSLAIAIGTAHGAYKFKPGQKPQLRFDILEEIVQLLPGYPLVLHGASSVPHDRLSIFNQYGGQLEEAVGIPETMLREAAGKGICKINVGTDIRVCYFGQVRKACVEHPDKFDGKTYLGSAKQAVADMIEDKIINVLGSDNKSM